MTTRTQTLFRSYIIEEYHLTEEPYYVPLGDEVQLFEAAYAQKIPLIFKGPDRLWQDALRGVYVLPHGAASHAGEAG